MRASEAGKHVELNEKGRELVESCRQKKLAKMRAELERVEAMCPTEYLEVFGVTTMGGNFELAGRLAQAEVNGLRFMPSQHPNDSGWVRTFANGTGVAGSSSMEQVQAILCDEEV